MVMIYAIVLSAIKNEDNSWHSVFICSASAALCLFALADEWQPLHIGGLSCSQPFDHGKKGAVKGPLSPLQSQEQAIAG